MINYYLLTKPGIILGNLIPLVAGFLLASKGHFYPGLFFATFFGLAFIMASACVLNNYIDKKIDKEMERTKNRALAQGTITDRNAIFFATLLGIIGSLFLIIFTNLLTVVVAAIGYFVYVVLYSLWKCHTIYGTAIGSIAGAVPPVVGYCAVSNAFDLGALILFLMLVLWQMPHFYAIAIYHLEDYTKANIPVLPVKKGMLRTKIHMLLYIIAFIAISALLTYFNYTGYLFLFFNILLGMAWLAIGFTGFNIQNNQLWGRKMFQFSLVVIGGLCLIMPVDVIH